MKSNNEIHFKDSDGFEIWCEYDGNGKLIHYKNSDGFENWYDSNENLIHYKNSNGNKITKKEFDELKSSCDGKVVEIDGKNYQLKLV